MFSCPPILFLVSLLFVACFGRQPTDLCAMFFSKELLEQYYVCTQTFRDKDSYTQARTSLYLPFSKVLISELNSESNTSLIQHFANLMHKGLASVFQFFMGFGSSHSIFFICTSSDFALQYITR